MAKAKTETMKKLSDAEKATLFLFISQKGLPSWGQKKKGQARVLAALTGWTEKRAEQSFKKAQDCGYCSV